MTNLEISIKYCEDIINGKILSCNYIKQGCKRFLNDLENPLYFYNSTEVDKVITFINSLNLTEMLDNPPFLLQPWQTFIISNIYGIFNKKRNIRKYQFVYLELPRKNGKSQLINALAVYHLIFDNDSQVVVSANSREQAKNVDFKKVKTFCSQIDPRKRYLKQLYNSVKYQNNELLVFASDSTKLDGYNISVGIIDELHAAVDSGMYDIIKTSQKTRLSPLLLVITTAGESVDSFCYGLRTYCTEILSEAKKDDSQFAMIYTIDEGDDYTHPDSIRKANPNIGISFFEYAIEIEIDKAINNPVEEAAIKRLYFNIWMQNKNIIETYIEYEYIKQSSQKLNLNDFKGLECFVGLDLASTRDITACSFLIPKDDKIYYLTKYYLPENNLNTHISRKKYKEWCDQGYITLTPGNVTDYDYILSDINSINKELEVNKIFYDKADSTQFIIDCTEEGYNTFPYAQSYLGMNGPTKELSRLMMNDRIIMDYNPITEWMFNNVYLKESSELIKPYKKSKTEKIDGVIAMIIALGGYLNMNHYSFDVT